MDFHRILYKYFWGGQKVFRPPPEIILGGPRPPRPPPPLPTSLKCRIFSLKQVYTSSRHFEVFLKSSACIKSHLPNVENRVYINCDHRSRSVLTDGIFWETYKECNGKKRIVLLHSGECNSIFLLHPWEIELSIRHHVTKINQLHDLNLTRYYIINNYWMRSSRIWGIVKAEVCVICRSRRLR